MPQTRFVIVDQNGNRWLIASGANSKLIVSEVDEGTFPYETTIANVSAPAIIPSTGTAPNDVPYTASFTLTDAVWSWDDEDDFQQTGAPPVIQRRWLIDGVESGSGATLAAGTSDRIGATIRYSERAQDPRTGEWSDWVYAADITPITDVDSEPVPPESLTPLDADWGPYPGRYVDENDNPIFLANPTAADKWQPRFWVKYSASGYGEVDPSEAPIFAVEWGAGSAETLPDANFEPAVLLETLVDGRKIYGFSLRDTTATRYDLVPRPNGATEFDFAIRTKFEETQDFSAQTSPRKLVLPPPSVVKPAALTGWTVTPGSGNGAIVLNVPNPPATNGDATTPYTYQWHNTSDGWQAFTLGSSNKTLPTALHGTLATIKVKAIGANLVESPEASATVQVPGVAPTTTQEWREFLLIGKPAFDNQQSNGYLYGFGGYEYQHWQGGDVAWHNNDHVITVMDVDRFAITLNATAAQPYWQFPEGNGATSRYGITARWHPTNAGEFLYVGSERGDNLEKGGIFRTTNYGKDFTRVAGLNDENLDFGANQFTTIGGQASYSGTRRAWCRSITFDPSNTSRVMFANQNFGSGGGSGGETVVSTDGGRNWSISDTYFRNASRQTPYTLACSANGTWYVGTSQGIHSRTFNGSWSNGFRNGIANGAVIGIECHPTNADIAYVSVYDGGYWRTTDGFASFQEIGPNRTRTWNIFAARHDFNKVWIMGRNQPSPGTQGQFSQNGLAANANNVSWSTVSVSNKEYGWERANKMLNVPGGSKNEFYGGVMPLNTGNQALGVAHARHYKASNGQNFISAGGGLSTEGAGDENANTIIFDPNDPDVMVICIMDRGSMWSLNGGQYFREMSHGSFGAASYQNGGGTGSISPGNGNRMILTGGGYDFWSAGISDNIRTSFNNGSTPNWNIVSQIRNDSATGNANQPVCRYVKFSHASENGSVLYTDHHRCLNANASFGNMNWEDLRNRPGFPSGGFAPQVVFCSYTNTGVVYAINAAGNTLHRSSDHGSNWSSWRSLGTSLWVGGRRRHYGIGIDPLNHDRVAWFVPGVGLRIYNGANDSLITVAQDVKDLSRVWRVKFSYRTPGVVYFQSQATGQGGIWRVHNYHTASPVLTHLKRHYPNTGAARSFDVDMHTDMLFQFGTTGTRWFPPFESNTAATNRMEQIKIRTRDPAAWVSTVWPVTG